MGSETSHDFGVTAIVDASLCFFLDLFNIFHLFIIGNVEKAEGVA
jgi:hypothetical protein